MAGDILKRTHEVLNPGARDARELIEYRNKILRERRASDLRWLMEDPRGRRIIQQLLASARFMEVATTPEQVAIRNFMVPFAGELVALDFNLWQKSIEESHSYSKDAGFA